VPRLTAVVCTRDRPDLLGDCLQTLARQSVPPGELEILVVDDGSATALDDVVASVSTAGMPVRLHRQAAAGLQAARNTGIDLARGDVIAFLDDDTLVPPTWASSVLETFDRFKCDGLAGRIELRLEGPDPGWLGPRLRAYLSELDYGSEPHILARRDPFGANCAVTAAAARSLDGFRAGLGRTGTLLLSSEEIDFYRRLRDAGGTIAYSPDAWVTHRVPPGRLTAEWFRRLAYAQGVSDVLLYPPRGGVDRVRRIVVEALLAMMAGPILVKNLIQGRGTVSARAWVSLYRGRLRTLVKGPSSFLAPQTRSEKL